MKSRDPLQAACNGHPAFYAGTQQSGTERNAESRPQDAPGLPNPASPPRPMTQAERSVVHPDRDDLEWGYCRGGWAG